MSKISQSIFVLLGMILPVLLSAAAEEISVQLIATGQNRAIVLLNGERRVLDHDAPAKDGVELLRADSSEAVLRVGVQELVLRSGTVATSVLDEAYTPVPSQANAVTLWADSDGFFHADGSINSQPVRFLVDTGANTIALSSNLADRLNIDYGDGIPGFVTTASGVTPVKMIKLQQIRVGSITSYNLEAGVIQGDHPKIPLLGAPFLDQVKMVRSGQRMDLRR